MPKLQEFSSRVAERGIVQGVDAMIVPKESVYMANNLVFDQILGAGVIRSGTALVGNQVGSGQKCLGYHQFTKTDGTNVSIAVFNNAGDTVAGIYYLNAGVWTLTAITTLTKDLPCVFLTFLNTVAVSNGTDAVLTSTNGSTWVTTGGNLDAANFPKFTAMIEWQDRIYGVTTNSNHVLYSGIQSGGILLWSGLTSGYIDIEPEDGGGSIVAFSKVPNYLVILKERSIKRWNGYSTFPDDVMGLGTFNRWSAVYGKSSCFFINKNGIYETNGGFPIYRSRPVLDIINAIDPASYGSVSGFCDGRHLEFSIGTIVIDGITYTNSAVRYALETQQWEFRTYSHTPVQYGRYLTTNVDVNVFADTDGHVIQIDTGVADTTTQIPFSVQTQEFTFGPSITNVNRMCFHTRGMYGASIFARLDKGDFQIIGTVNSDNQLLENMGLSGTYFEFRVAGYSSDKYGYWSGITILDAESTADFR